MSTKKYANDDDTLIAFGCIAIALVMYFVFKSLYLGYKLFRIPIPAL